MKKSLVKFFAGVTAAASLMLAGCTNQLDYVNQTTAINKMKIAGFTVSGLDSAYDGATANLMVYEGDYQSTTSGDCSAVSIGTTTVAKTYVDSESGKTVGYESGKAYLEFDEPYIFDGDTYKTSSVKLYLQIGLNKFLIEDPANGKFTTPELKVKTSDAGTSDEKLASSFVAVNVYNDVAEYSWASTASAPVATPVYMCDFDISSSTSASDLPAGVTITTAEKSGTNNKYTVNFKGLVDNKGTKFVVAGAAISSTDENLGENWNIMESAGLKVTAVVTDKGLISTVDNDGNVTFTFYGSKPTWASNKSPAIKIAAYNVDKDPWICLLAANSGNFFFPNWTDGYDTTMTVDIAALSTSSWKKSDATYAAKSFYIDGIKVINAQTPNDTGVYFTEGPDADDRINWVPENAWSTECHKYTKEDINSNGNYVWQFDEAVKIEPKTETFRIGARLCNPIKDGGFWGNVKGSYTTTLKTTDYDGMSMTLVIDGTSGSEYLAPTSMIDYEYVVTLNNLVLDCALEDVELIGDFNDWKDTGTIAGVADEDAGTTTFDVSSIAAKALGAVKVRSTGKWDGTYNIGCTANKSTNIELPSYTKNGKVNIMCKYDAAKKDVTSITLKYVD